MARSTTRYVCQSCGAVHARWSGRCDGCGEWNCIAEEPGTKGAPLGGKSKGRRGQTGGRKIEFVTLDHKLEPAPRRLTQISEFDRVTGGGLVPGSALLIGGDPGIGKSTLLLQVVASLGSNTRCAYISGEEAVDQIQLRASRLGVQQAPLELAAATDMASILVSLDSLDRPDVVVIDSIQTMYIEALESAPGTVSQVRACSQEIIRLAKQRGFTVLLVGHVTKDGMIAGPRVLEHMVDTVLYFEGERGHQFRILRAVKNRYGPTDEIGVFEMTDRGLMEVSNPSALFLAERQGEVAGAAVFAGMEGSRPVLVEIQALVAPSTLATPRRAVVGWDGNRLAMVLAVLEARCGLQFGGNDIYLNVAGGLRIREPAADLAVAAALTSSISGTPVASDMVVFGEVGLSGEVRPVGQMGARQKEAEKLGFSAALLPKSRDGTRGKRVAGGLKLHELQDLGELARLFEARPGPVQAVGNR